MKIFHVYPVSCEYAYPKYLDKSLPQDQFDLDIICNTDLEVRYLRGLHELGEECTLLYPRRFNLPVKEFKHKSGYKLVRLPITFFEGRNGLELPLSMFKYIKKEKPDLVHYHGIYGGRYYFPKFFNLMAWFCKVNNIPFFGWYHTGELVKGHRFPLLVKPIRWAKVAALRSCKGLTSINHLELEKLFNPQSSFYYGVNLSNVPYCLAANTIDVELFSRIPRNEAVDRLGLDTNKRYILMVARLFFEKGLHHLINIFPEITKRHPDVHLLIVGDFIEDAQKYRETIHETIKEKRLGERITFVGRVEHQKGLTNYYNCADVFVLPTLKETFGGVNLEAIACGVPVVSTDCGEIPYYLKKGLGYVVPKGDEAELLNAIVKVLSGQFVFDENERIGVIKKYDYRFASRTLRNWYRSILIEATR